MPRLTRATHPARAAARSRRRGFSLVELLVAVTLVLLVTATVSVVFTGQLRGYTRTREASAIQRDLRTSLSLLPTDLRAASVALGDITSATDSAVRLRANFGSSIVCERPAANVIVLPPLGLARNVLTSWYTPPKVGDWLTVYVSSDADPSRDSWRPLRIAAIDTAPATMCAGAPFTDPVRDPPSTKKRLRITLSDTVSVVEAGPGKPIRFLRLVKYGLMRASTNGSGWYLGYADSVDGAWTTAEPIAGPFAAYAPRTAASPSGITFTYFDTSGVRIATPSATSRFGRVDVALRGYTRVKGGRDSVVVRDSVLLRIALRNRQVQ